MDQFLEKTAKVSYSYFVHAKVSISGNVCLGGSVLFLTSPALTNVKLFLLIKPCNSLCQPGYRDNYTPRLTYAPPSFDSL